MDIALLISTLYVFGINSILCANEDTARTECPPGFKEMQSVCYIETEKTTFPYHCPFRYSVYEFVHRASRSAWLNVRREREYGFFPAPELNYLYGFLLWPVANIPSHDFEDCIIGNRESTANCTDKYSGLCVYPKNDRQFCEAYDKICNDSRSSCHCRSQNILYLCQMMCVPSDYEECSVCDQKFAQYPEPELHLSFNGIDRLRLEVIGPLKLITPGMQDTRFYCFSNVYEPSSMDIHGRPGPLTMEAETMTRMTYTFPVDARAVGLYWCEGFTYENHRRVVSKTIMAGVRSAYGFTFVLNFTLEEFTLTPYDVHTQSTRVTLRLMSDLLNNYQSVRPPVFAPLYNNRSMAYVTLHITARPHVTDAENEFGELTRKLENCESYGFKNCSLALSDLCLPQVSTIGSGLTASWPKAFLGQRIMPREILLRENGLPITRRCVGSFTWGAYWSDVTGEVSIHGGSDVTNALHELIKANKTARDLNKALFDIISNDKNIIPVDVYLVARIFESIAQSGEDFDIELLVKNMDVIMEIDLGVLQVSQGELNATDMILYNFDVALGALAGNSTTTIISKNIMAQVTPLGRSDGINGVAVYHQTGEKMQLRNLTNVTAPSEVDLDCLKLAVFIPPKLLREIFVQARAPNLITTVFHDDALFRSNKHEGLSVANAIVGVFVTNFVGVHLPEPLPVIFAPSYKTRSSSMVCGFWKFGINDVQFAIHGRWRKEHILKNYGKFKACTFNHMTHFAILANATRNQVLDLISIVGCALSVLGVLGIIITAMAFKSWRNCMATKILLNLSLTILIQMSLLFLSHMMSTAWWCTILTISLHYVIVTQFFWMFVIGYLQYRKFVQVLVKEPAHLLLYSSIFAWITPTFPVAIVFFLTKGSYAEPPYCFLSGPSLHFGVFLPVGCVVVSNLTIFVLIFANLSCTKARAFGAKQNTFLLRVKLSFVLFFLMGFSWIFGLLAYFSESIILSYMFCVTSTIQGFVLYVYFVMCNKITRKFWVKNILCCTRNVQEPSKSHSAFNSKLK